MKIFKKLISFVLVATIISITFSPIQTKAIYNLSINRETVNAAVLLYTLDDLYLMRLKEGLENIQKEKDNQITFTFFDGKNNISIQNETLDSVLINGIDLLIVALADQSELVVKEVLYKAKQNNTPIILIGVSPQVISNIYKDYNKAAFISPDLKVPGILEGKILVNLWNENKKVIDKNNDNIMNYVLLHGKPNSNIAIQRTKNTLSTIAESGIKTNQLQLVYTNWSKDLARTSIENLFLKYGNKIEVIISNNDNMSIGAIEALQKYGYNLQDKSKYIAVVGIDGLPEAKDLIDKGYMTGTVDASLNTIPESIYTIGMNLVKDINPIENTNYQITNGEIIIPLFWTEYVKKA
jgi:methyl-galactoside transport system substrate-binding protein